MSSTEPPPDGRRTRWDAHRAQRREQVITAALAVLAEVGTDFGLDQVAERAGITKPVIYRHFTDRAGLVEAMSRHAMTVLTEERILPRLRASDAVVARIRSTVDAILGFFEEDPNVYWLVVNPGAPHGSEMSRIKELVAGVLATLLGDLLRAGRVTEYLTILIWSQVDGFARRHGLELDPEEPLTPESMMRRRPSRRDTAG